MPSHLSTEKLANIDHVRAKINWDRVLRLASSLRGQSCKRENVEFYGGCNLISSLVFEDGTRWAFRVPHDLSPTPFRSTVDTMHYVKRAVPDIPIAIVHTFSDSEDGDGVGLPYMLLDWIEGQTLEEWSSDSPPGPQRRKVLAQLARITVALLRYTSEVEGSGSTLAWMRRRVNAKLKRILTGDLTSFDPVDCLIYAAMAEEKYLVRHLDGLPFPLMHADLSILNIIVDSEYNITGILDWDDWARRSPLQFALMYPRLIELTGDSVFDGSLRQDRLCFLEHFTPSLATSGLDGAAVASLPLILADDELQTFHASFWSKSVYADWVARYCIRNKQWVAAAVRALENFVLDNVAWADSAEVRSLRSRLEMRGEGEQENSLQ